MPSNRRKLWPMKVTYFFLSCVGFGVAKTKNDRKLLNISLYIFLFWSTTSIYFSATNVYLTVIRGGAVDERIEAMFPLITSSLTHFKLILFTIQRKDYERLLQLTDETLWNEWWTEYGKIVLEKCERRAKLFLFVFVILGHASGAGWIVEPLLLNMKTNSSDPNDRHLPTETILGFNQFVSPNYEIIYVTNLIQWNDDRNLFKAVGIYVITILYFCFDYYLVLINIFVAGQFDILRQRYEVVNVRKKSYNNEKNNQRQCKSTDYSLQEFKNCVEQHQFLLSLVDDIESIYNIMNLAQVLMLSLIICIVGYPLLMPDKSALTVVKNGIFIGSCFIQLFTFTLSCHNIMIASSDIGNGIYDSEWYYANNTKEGRSLSKNFMLVLMKTKYPCYLTGLKFFPITLDTLKSILTTAFSYLTLIRQSMAE